MQVINIHTGETKDLPDDIGKMWVRSCTPWYSNDWSPQDDLPPSAAGKTTRTRYDLNNMDPESIHQFWNCCLSCSRSVIFAREIGEILQNKEAPNSIWMQAKFNAYAIAVMEWSKGFGANSEEYHWKRVFGENSGFIQELWEATGIREETYFAYWRDMQHIRISRIAHSGLPNNPAPQLPDFNLAIKLFAATHPILVRILKELTNLRFPNIYVLEPMSFDDWLDSLRTDFRNEIEPAIVASLETS
ncbi:hypothetical protein [Marinobacter sp. 2_MG-2023]|uniref:hypothetical protein n=1 Tax=Marinobacter sp. 2_MG-2023 TaxID=3062679 RepID=UPI0026E1DCD5|nr:hypothetical protein [Marinobacter sp. 2_MG-2023]MDO6444142.1 hypothetical protein [Marinobacter sp. 2_MG-2023]